MAPCRASASTVTGMSKPVHALEVGDVLILRSPSGTPFTTRVQDRPRMMSGTPFGELSVPLKNPTTGHRFIRRMPKNASVRVLTP